MRVDVELLALGGMGVLGKASKAADRRLGVESHIACEVTDRWLWLQSGIHGWGLIAKQEMKQDSMIIEYRGESLRRLMADARERIYRGNGMDCYLFNVNDDVVIDATMKGATGRFTVSLFSRVQA